MATVRLLTLVAGTASLAVPALALALGGTVRMPAGDDDAPTPTLPAADDEPTLRDFLDHWCIRCHRGAEPKAGLDLAAFVPEAEDASPARLRSMIDRLVARDMPPSRIRPSEAEYERAIAQLRGHLERRRDAAGAGHADPGRPTARRLTRVEYANAVRDLFGVAIDARTLLPADEVGGAFDNDGDVNSIPPLLFEKYFDVAEAVARAAIRPAAGAAPPRTRLGPDALDNDRGGRRIEGRQAGWSLFSNGTVAGGFEAPARGTYRLRARVAGQQAGAEPVEFAYMVDGRPVATTRVTEDRRPVVVEHELELDEGPHRLGVAFTNDDYRPEAADPADRDRNAWVGWIELEGPAALEPTALQRRLARLEGGDRLAREIGFLAERTWRRPVEGEVVARLVELARAAAGDEAAHEDRLRAAIVTLLVHPRFLLRIERSPEPGAEPIPLDDFEIATRLAAFLWASVPDETLAADAAAGRLLDAGGRRAAVERMLADPRSIALAEHFGTQWLRVRGVRDREVDPTRFGGVDEDLRRTMLDETVRFLDAMLRERRPVRELVTADWTFLDARLAEHYGLDAEVLLGPEPGSGLRRVSLAGGPAVREGGRGGLGVLRHASVLLATSNPTRTSPVKRGKWVLEALLHDPPPPPPPDAGVLAEATGAAAARTIRERLELHRRDASCAACHRRLDPLGFALESFDAVGRPRTEDEGRPVDDRGELPGGRVLDGPFDLRDALVDDPRFVRSIAAHLAEWAIGRGLRDADADAIDRVVATATSGRAAANEAALADFVLAVVESPIFLERAAAAPTAPVAAAARADDAPIRHPSLPDPEILP